MRMAETSSHGTIAVYRPLNMQIRMMRPPEIKRWSPTEHVTRASISNYNPKHVPNGK